MKAERTQKKQFILAVSGVKNSGKTTLITKILHSYIFKDEIYYDSL